MKLRYCFNNNNNNSLFVDNIIIHFQQFIASFISKYSFNINHGVRSKLCSKTFCSLVDSGISIFVDSIEIFNDIIDHKHMLDSQTRNNMCQIEPK